MQRWGNAKANSYWERKMPEGFPRPTENSTMEEAEAFIRVKYEQQSFVDPSFDPNLQPIATPTLTPVSTPRETDEEEEEEVGSNSDSKHHHSHSTSRHSSHRHHSHHRSSSSKKEDGLDGFFNDDNKPKDELNDGIERVVEKLDDFHLNNESIFYFIYYYSVNACKTKGSNKSLKWSRSLKCLFSTTTFKTTSEKDRKSTESEYVDDGNDGK